jgi:3-isopropylmalate dehydratase small subunit
MGLPIFESAEASEKIEVGDEIEVDMDTGVIKNLTKNEEYKASPIPPFMQELIKSGGLMESIKKKIGA